MIEPSVLILVLPGDSPWLVERTRRSLARDSSRLEESVIVHVCHAEHRAECAAGSKSALMTGADRQVLWLVNAGSWTPVLRLVTVPVSTQPLALIGATLDATNRPDAAWQDWLKGTGGIATHKPPTVHSVCLNEAAQKITDSIHWRNLADLIATLHERGVRIIRHTPLDVRYDKHLRVLEVVTSLQRGGAERMVLGLHRELPAHGVASTLCVLGSPTRASFETPVGVVSLKHLPFDSVARAEGIDQTGATSGCDMIHAHLIEGETAKLLALKGWPVMVTLHNERAGWQSGFDQTLPASPKLMLVACSGKVQRDARAELPGVMLRTAWNGIHANEFQMDERQHWRDKLGIEAGEIVLLVLANPRPQKRMALTAEIFARWNSRQASHLILAGEPSMFHESAATELSSFWQVIDYHGLRARVHAAGGVEDVASLLSACDVLLSASAHEGMSLAQIEAIAAGLRLVITDAGGADELSSMHHSVVVVSRDASPAIFVDAIREALQRERSVLAWDFSARAMALRYRWLMRLLLRNRATEKRGMLLVTNNFSTGGAQSSARRLLMGLRDAGERVRAAVLQEWPEMPTPGRSALIDAGIEVVVIPPPEAAEATTALMTLLDEMDRDPPAVVLFWNVMPEYKLLLAEAFDDVPVIDVSPGEMFFESLQRYFMKPRAGSPYRSVRDYSRLLSMVVVKHTQEEAKARELFGVPVRVIANGVKLASQCPVRCYEKSHPLVIGTAARLHPHKRLEDLLEAFRLVCQQHSDVTLLVAGGEEAGFEPYAEELRLRANDLPVKWLGDVQDMAGFHSSIHVFAMISEPVGCPNASLEAMAAGLPIVATAVGGAMDQVVDGESGLLVPPRNVAALASAMLRLLGDAQLRDSLGRAARERINQCFSLECMINGYKNVMREVIESRCA